MAIEFATDLLHCGLETPVSVFESIIISSTQQTSISFMLNDMSFFADHFRYFVQVVCYTLYWKNIQM